MTMEVMATAHSFTVFLPEGLRPLIHKIVSHCFEGAFGGFAEGQLAGEVARERVAEASALLERVEGDCLQDTDAPLLYNLMLKHLTCREHGERSLDELWEAHRLQCWLNDVWADLEEREAAGA